MDNETERTIKALKIEVYDLTEEASFFQQEYQKKIQEIEQKRIEINELRAKAEK